MTDLLPAIAGFLVLALVGVDVFVTVFHPEGHGGPLTRRQNRLVWASWKATATRRSRRNRWLALAGPVLAALTPIVWAGLLVAGYALVYYPWIADFLVSPGALRSEWAEAAYVSGITAATLGTGDVVPDLVPLRLLGVLEAFSGFALLSASLSYILSVYQEHAAKTTLASDLAAHFSAAGVDDDQPWRREAWLERTAERLLHVAHAHAQYPILHYFRPSDERSSLTLQLRALVERATGAGDGSPRSHAEQVVLGALDEYLAAAHRRFVPGGPGGGDEPPIERRYERLLCYLGYESDAFGEPG